MGWRPNAADRRLLLKGRISGPMPWVIAIMLFLTALATAAGLGLGQVAQSLGGAMAGRMTIQLVEANPDLRSAQAEAAVRTTGALPGVRSVRRVPDAELAALLEPWLGEAALGQGLPVPALIDLSVAPGGADAAAVERAVRSVAPSARVDTHAAWLAPLGGMVAALRWLAAGLVALMAVATTAAVVLAARAALDTHRDTIDVLHLLGSTDVQIARLFQRRIALDALIGGIAGLAGAITVILLIGDRINAVGSDLLGSARLGATGWALLAGLPLVGSLLAMLAARVTVLRTLRRML